MKNLLALMAIVLISNSAFAKDMRCKKWTNGHAVRAKPKSFKLSERGQQTFKYEVENTLVNATTEKLQVEVTVKKQTGSDEFIITSLNVEQNASNKIASKAEVLEGARVLSTELSVLESKVGIVCSINLL